MAQARFAPAAAVLLAGLCASGAAPAGKVKPEQVDLKAAFCIGMLRADLAAIEHNGGAGANDGSIIKARSALQRLDRFLVPRMAYLETAEIENALALGRQAAMRANDDFDACSRTCADDAACLDRCVSRSMAMTQTWECNSPAFLPF